MTEKKGLDWDRTQSPKTSKTERGSQQFGHLKWLEGRSKQLYGQQLSSESECDFTATAQLFWPLHILLIRSPPPENVYGSSDRNAGKLGTPGAGWGGRR